VLLPIATDGIKLEVTSEPKAITNYDNGAPKLDEKGRPLFSVRVLWDDGKSTEMITIKVGGQPPAFGHRAQVKAVGLVAQPYVVNGKDGISFTAESLQPATASSKAA